MTAFLVLVILGAAQSTAPTSDPALTAGRVVLLANEKDAAATDIVRRALADPDPLVRRAAARVASVAHPEAFDSLRQALEIERDPVVIAEFVKDIMALAGAKALPIVEAPARAAGIDAIVPIAEWFARMQPDEFLRQLPEWSRVPGSADRLTDAVALAASRHPDLRDPILAAWKPIASEAAWKRASDIGANNHVVMMRTPPDLAARVMANTLSAAGCTPKKGMVGSALVTYAPGGRPTRIDVNVARLPHPCQNALTAIARVGLDEYDSGGRPQTLIFPLTPDFTSCTADIDPDEAPHPLGPLSRVKDPILKKEVKPDYTEAALRRKVEGVEELDAVVSRAGCASSAKVTRTLDPELDAQGIIAVIQWRFQPGMLDGTPVPVLVSVELTFTLRR